MPHPGDYFGLYSVAFSPDGQWLLTAHKDGNARLWDWRTGRLIRAPMPHPGEVYDAQFTPDGRHVVTAGRHFSPRVWDVATGKQAVALPQVVPEGSISHALAIAGDRVIVTAGNRYSVLDLSLLRQKPTDELPTLLTRAELTTNQKLQFGELVQLEQDEWTSRWEQWVAARQTPEEMARSLASNFDEAQSESARHAVAIRAIRFNLTERLQQLRPNDPRLQIALAVEFSRAGRQSELQQILPKAMADGGWRL
jgi:WD40 repeat protein